MTPGPPPPPPPPPPEVPPPPEDIPMSRPAWRTVRPRGIRRSRERQDAPPPPQPVPEPEQVHSWVEWQPNPALAPTPPPVEPTLLVPDPGLFGLRPSPPPPEVPSPPEGIPLSRPAWRTVPPRGICPTRERQDAPSPPQPVPEPEQVHSWVEWQPNPALAPTPPPVEPTLFVPDRGSPTLFGPRSPRN